MPQGYLAYFAQTFTAMAPYEGAHSIRNAEPRALRTRRRRARRTARSLRRTLTARATHA